jgi:hypothetical protein
MKNPVIIFILSLLLFTVAGEAEAQSGSVKQKKTKADKEAEETSGFAGTDSLINSRQFVFAAEFNPGSDMTFVIVDSAACEIQCGNRNNLVGKITSFETSGNLKSKTFSVTVKMRSAMSSADIFIFTDAFGFGNVRVSSDFPGVFSFNGNLVDFEHAQFYEGGSHLTH